MPNPRVYSKGCASNKGLLSVCWGQAVSKSWQANRQVLLMLKNHPYAFGARDCGVQLDSFA
jgi:hypothetical protein